MTAPSPILDSRAQVSDAISETLAPFYMNPVSYVFFMFFFFQNTGSRDLRYNTFSGAAVKRKTIVTNIFLFRCKKWPRTYGCATEVVEWG